MVNAMVRVRGKGAPMTDSMVACPRWTAIPEVFAARADPP